MKTIEQKPKGFQPFSILVESQNEANYFASLIGNSTIRVLDLFNIASHDACRMYNDLSSRADAEIIFDIEVSN